MEILLIPIVCQNVHKLNSFKSHNVATLSLARLLRYLVTVARLTTNNEIKH